MRALVGWALLLFFIQRSLYQLNASVYHRCFTHVQPLGAFLQISRLFWCESNFQPFSFFVARRSSCSRGHCITSLLPVHIFYGMYGQKSRFFSILPLRCPSACVSSAFPSLVSPLFLGISYYSGGRDLFALTTPLPHTPGSLPRPHGKTTKFRQISPPLFCYLFIVQ